jgi:nitrogen fixation NifU-like protein
MYNSIVVENFSNPCHSGKVTSPDFSIELGNPVCGDKIIIQGILSNNQLVTKSKFQAWGCATTIATANIFCGYLLNKSFDEITGTKKEIINELLGDLEPSQHHCLEMLKELFQKVSELCLSQQCN